MTTYRKTAWHIWHLAFTLIACGSPGLAGSGEISADGKAPVRPADYMTASNFPRLILELDHTEGRAPRQSVTQRILLDLDKNLHKPDGIAIINDTVLLAQGNNHVWDFSALRRLADTHFDLQVDPGTIKLHVLFLDGRYTDEDVLGIAWGNRTAVVFRDRIQEICEARLDIINREAACEHGEHGVFLHEIGHVLGLVNNGLTPLSDHEEPHPDRARHCRHDDCAMYWAYARPDAFDLIRDRLLGNGGYVELGTDCQADLNAAR